MGGFPFWLKPKLVWMGATYPTICVTNIYKHQRETTTSFLSHYEKPPAFSILYKHNYQLPQTNERSLPFSGVFPMMTDDQCGTFMVMNKVPDDQPTCFRILWKFVLKTQKWIIWDETRQKRLKNIEITTRQIVQSRTSNSRECSSWKFQLWI